MHSALRSCTLVCECAEAGDVLVSSLIETVTSAPRLLVSSKDRSEGVGAGPKEQGNRIAPPSGSPIILVLVFCAVADASLQFRTRRGVRNKAAEEGQNI